MQSQTVRIDKAVNMPPVGYGEKSGLSRCVGLGGEDRSANQKIQNQQDSYLKSELTTQCFHAALQDMKIEQTRSSLNSLGFDINNKDTNTSGYYCYDALAAEDARYQAMISKYGRKLPSRKTEYNKDVHR